MAGKPKAQQTGAYSKGNAPERFRVFQVVIYPDEDPKHYVFLNYVMTYYDCNYIVHDRDVYEEDIKDESGNIIHEKGSLKKRHTHVIWRVKDQWSEPSIRKYYDPWLKMQGDGAIHGVRVPEAACKYFLHQTPDSSDKPQYSFEEIKKNSNYFDHFYSTKCAFCAVEENIEILNDLKQKGTTEVLDVVTAFKDKGYNNLEWLMGHTQLVNQFVRDQQFKARFKRDMEQHSDRMNLEMSKLEFEKLKYFNQVEVEGFVHVK